MPFSDDKKRKECAKAYYKKNKEMMDSRSKIYYQENKEKMNAAMKEYYKENKNNILTSSKKYRERTKDKKRINDKVYYELHKEKILAYGKDWRGSNKEKKQESNRRWYEGNKERVRLSSRIWGKNNRDKKAKMLADYRANKFQATSSWGNKKYISLFYKFAKLEQERIGEAVHVDHIVPIRSKHVCGLHNEDNLQLLTAADNYTKNNHHWPNMWQ